MANKKVKPSEDYYDFLPTRVQESTKLDQSEKNILATLCFFRMNYSIYAEKHDGWFYTSQKDIEEGAELSHMQTNRILLKLETKKVIERKSGTTHRPTHYRIHPKIVELLPITEHANDTQDRVPLTPNDTQVEKTSQIEANDTQDKIREVKKRQDKSFLITSPSKSIESNKCVVGDSFQKEESQQHDELDFKVFFSDWSLRFENCKFEEEIEQEYKNFVVEVKKNADQLFSEKGKIYLEQLKDKYDKLWLHLHYKKSKQ